MQPASQTVEDLINHPYVREMVERLGGNEGMIDASARYREVAARMFRERADLVKQHPDKWVAMGRGGVEAIGGALEDVLDQVDAKGVSRDDVFIEFLDTDPPVLIL